jgi:hypothetical protein
MSEPIVNLINVDEIVKKPKTSTKPRMSKIVSKAVLLKQISDSKIIVDHVIIDPPPQAVASADVKITIIEETTEQVLKPQSVKTCSVARKTKVREIVPLSGTTPPSVVPIDSLVSITSYKCDLCNTVFTSRILYERHPRTIRHKTNLIKEFESKSRELRSPIGAGGTKKDCVV